MSANAICEGVAGVGDSPAFVKGTPQWRNVHYRLKRDFGSAWEYDCIVCEDVAREWAWQHGEDPSLTTSYEPMCKACHRLYDSTPEWGAAIGRSQVGNTRSAGHVNNILGSRRRTR